MGFTSVYRSLTEIFPQVDARMLRAVAIEHPKDADEAAAVVLSDILPSWPSHSRNKSTPSISEREVRAVRWEIPCPLAHIRLSIYSLWTESDHVHKNHVHIRPCPSKPIFIWVAMGPINDHL
ncbi:hypothetical protein Bca4012_038716 [Brassica carinata]